jgi:hypothetical protein
VGAFAATASADHAPVDAFLCRQIGRSDGATASATAVVDHFTSEEVAPRSPRRLCEPVALAGHALLDPATHLVGHRIRTTGRAPKRPGIPVESALAAESWDLGRPGLLLAPAAVAEGAPPPPPDPASHAVDAYRCWRARSGEAVPAAPQEVEVTTADGGTRRLELGAPRHLCSPAEIDGDAMKSPPWHLACYAARPADRASRDRSRRDLGAATAIGAAEVDVHRVRELCLPARALPSCNGSRELCARRFDEVAYATTHNAMSNVDDDFIGPNQRFTVARQLEDGVRGLMLDTHYEAGQPTLCHAACSLGSTPLVSTLSDIRSFLVRHPYEVVTIIFESYVSAADTAAAFAAAGLLDLAHSQPVGSAWPRLEEMIAADRRLVVLTDSGGGAFPWYHHVWAHAFETHYSWATPGSMNCDPNRGNPANPLFILNHFLTQVFGSPALAEQVNHDPFFIGRALQCQAERGTLPNFVTVDFHDVGDVFAVVDALNGIGP